MYDEERRKLLLFKSQMGPPAPLRSFPSIRSKRALIPSMSSEINSGRRPYCRLGAAQVPQKFLGPGHDYACSPRLGVSG